MRDSKITNPSIWKVVAQISLLTAIAFAIHALVLQFVYPGYYDPLWPNHDDYYIPVALANSPESLLDYLRYPRPVGTIFLGIIGHFGLHGSILAFLCLITLNCALAAEAFRRFTKIEMGLPFIAVFIIYLYLLFSQPYFYIFAIHDGFSQLSFSFLLLSILPLLNYDKTRSLSSLGIFFIIVTFGLLTKETYGLSAIFLAGVWFIAKRKEGAIQAAIPPVLTGVALATALAINSLNRSPFTSGSEGADAPYRIVLSPPSVVSEWLRYLTDGLNPLTGALVLLGVVTSITALRRKAPRHALLVALLPVAGVIAWLPTSLLPNHYYPGYSWNGAYLLFLPILSITLLGRRGWPSRLCLLAIMAIAIYSPTYSAGAYKRNDWALLQENIERNLLKALTKLTAELPSNQPASRILIAGIDFPFSPFKEPYSLRMFPHVRNVSFDVISYGPSTKSVDPNAGVAFVNADDVAFSNYQSVWAFRSDGTLILNLGDVGNFAGFKRDDLGFKAEDLLIYPKLLDVFDITSGSGKKRPNGYNYLKCGQVLASYADLAGATACLSLSIGDIPTNPYPYFYLGKIQEEQGLIQLARKSYEKAISLDDPKSPNPYFKSALLRISSLESNTTM